MNLRRLFNSILALAPKSYLEDRDLNMDAKESGTSLKHFDPETIKKYHNGLEYIHLPEPEKFSTALAIALEFRKINGIKERIAFWDKHPSVFGFHSVVVFDKKAEEYRGHHGQSYFNPIGDMEGWGDYTIDIRNKDPALDNMLHEQEIHEGRYEVAHIHPVGRSEFWPFMEWCTQKYKNTEGFTIMDEAHYWKRIKQNRFPQKFLTKLLKGAESYSNHISKVGRHRGDELLSAATAKEYFFYYGKEHATEGDLSGVDEVTFNLHTVYQKIVTCRLSTYGEIFFQYYDAYNAVEMVDFLQKQKKRLDKGVDEEMLRFPTTDESHQIQAPEINETQTLKATPSPVIDGQNPQVSTIFIKIAKRDTVKRQLSIELDEGNKARLIQLIDLNPPTEKIYTKTKAKVLADYFRQIYQTNDINNTDYSKDDIGNFLAHWFVRLNGKPYKPESFKYYLQLRDDNLKATGLEGKIKYPKV